MPEWGLWKDGGVWDEGGAGNVMWQPPSSSPPISAPDEEQQPGMTVPPVKHHSAPSPMSAGAAVLEHSSRQPAGAADTLFCSGCRKLLCGLRTAAATAAPPQARSCIVTATAHMTQQVSVGATTCQGTPGPWSSRRMQLHRTPAQRTLGVVWHGGGGGGGGAAYSPNIAVGGCSLHS